MLCAVAFAISAGVMFAQNAVGTWQGTLALPQPPGRTLRVVVKVSRGDDEKLKAIFYSIDQPSPGFNANAVSQQGSAFRMEVVSISGSFEGKIEGDSINGTWTQGAPMPLTLARATPATAWAIPDPPAPPKLMPADAKPVFEVATIKPTPPDSRGSSLVVGRGGGNMFSTTNTSLKDLMVFAYGLHEKQVSGGPSWVESEHYDITAKPDTEGMPSVAQLQAMLQKLVVERFELTFHKEKKELSVYAITAAKTGVKMNKSQANGLNLPGFGGRGQGDIVVRNSNMADFAGFLQSRIVDRPVVDQTGLTDRFDFQLKWQPDAAQPAAPGQPAAAAPASDAEPRPDLFGAFTQQLGLKLEATKAAVDVVVIDKVARPTEN